MKTYSPFQIAVGAFIGTPVAAAFFVARNLTQAYSRRLISIAAFTFVAGGYFLVTFLNPVLSRPLDTAIFIGFTVTALLANYILMDGRDEGEHAPKRQGWAGVIGISLLFCVLWIGLVFFVFN